MNYSNLRKFKRPLLKTLTTAAVVSSCLVAAATAHAAKLPNTNRFDSLQNKPFPAGTADPAARVFTYKNVQKLYVYTSTDSKNICSKTPNPQRHQSFSGFCMPGYKVFSTANANLSGWATSNIILGQESVPWAQKATFNKDKVKLFGATASMWAPDVIQADDKNFHMFFPTTKKNGVQTIGVAWSTNPAGPFKARKDPMPNMDHTFDPSVVKIGGQWYIFYAKAATANANDGSRHKDIWYAKTNASFTSTSGHKPFNINRNNYYEGPHAYQVKGKWYLQFANGSAPGGGYFLEQAAINRNGAGNISLQFKGAMVNKNTNAQRGTNHGSVVEFKNKTWVFYHQHHNANGWKFRRAGYKQVSPDATGYIPSFTAPWIAN